MRQHNLITVLSYSDEVTFETIQQTEQNILAHLQSFLNQCNLTTYTHTSTENTFTFQCELQGILPLHFIRDLAKSILPHLSEGVESRILLYADTLALIKGAVCKDGDFTIQSLNAVQSIGHRNSYAPPREDIFENQIFS